MPLHAHHAETLMPGLYTSGLYQTIPLAMQRLDLTGKILPTGSVLHLLHSFKCGGDKPMEAVYVFQLPRGGAVRRFKMKGKGFEVESKLSPREEARQTYEAGVRAGHVSALTETSPDGIVSLNVGQIQPDEVITIAVEIVCGVEVRDSSYRFRFPFTLAPNYHSGGQMTATPGGMKNELPQDMFGDLILPEFKEDASNLHRVGFNLRVESGGPVGTVGSPSHNVAIQPNADGTVNVSLSSIGDSPNRDLVLDVSPREITPQVFVDESITTSKPKASKFPKNAPRWVVTVPSDTVPQTVKGARKVVFLLDRSGSMAGVRIDRARAAIRACVSALDPKDEFGIVAFDTELQTFHPTTAPANDENRSLADKFLANIHAWGGTELSLGLGEAVKVLGGAGHDIFLITDGEVSETGPIIGQVAKAGVRVHVLGVGNAGGDRFLASLARFSGGVEKTVNSNEDVATDALELFNAVRVPRQQNMKVLVTLKGGKKQEQTVETVWNGRTIVITDDGSTGNAVPVEIAFGAQKKGKAGLKLAGFIRPQSDGVLALAWAGQRVEDLEIAIDMSKAGPAREATKTALVKLSTDYGLASRVMSLVAVHKRVGDQAGVDPVQQIVAVGMPNDRQSQSAAIHTSGVLRSLSHSFTLLGSYTGTNGPSSPTLYDATSNMFYSTSDVGQPADSLGSFRSLTLNDTTSLNGGTGVIVAVASVNMISDTGVKLDSMEYERASEIRERPSLPFGDSYKSAQISTKGGQQIRRSVQQNSVFMAKQVAPTSKYDASDIVTALGSIMADGGLPGSDLETRVTLTALFALTLNVTKNSYKLHLPRMLAFLEANASVADFLPGVITILKGTKTSHNDWGTSFREVAGIPWMHPKVKDMVWEGLRAAVSG